MFGHLYRFILAPAYDVLPPQMAGRSADAMLLTIALQESRCASRRQGGNGPARGFWQFELGGVKAVLSHRASAQPARTALAALCYAPATPATDIRNALEHNDVLACVFARLLLWTLPTPLPPSTAADLGWEQYIAAWQPGRPHRATWDGHFTRAWSAVNAGLED